MATDKHEAPAPQQQDGRRFADVVTLMKRLLAEDGCPWDREQTLHTLKPYLIEEAYELLEALESEDVGEHREQAGVPEHAAALLPGWQGDLREAGPARMRDAVVLGQRLVHDVQKDAIGQHERAVTAGPPAANEVLV